VTFRPPPKKKKEKKKKKRKKKKSCYVSGRLNQPPLPQCSCSDASTAIGTSAPTSELRSTDASQPTENTKPGRWAAPIAMRLPTTLHSFVERKKKKSMLTEQEKSGDEHPENCEP